MKRVGFLLALYLLLVGTAIDGIAVEREEAEISLEKAFVEIVKGNTQQAKAILIDTLADYPDFHLARMIYADLVAARAHHLPLLSDPAAQARTRTADLIEEAEARLAYRLSNSDKLPANIAKLSKYHRHALLFDADHSRLYVFENHDGTPYLIGDYYASAGKGGMNKAHEGDNRTPSGIYKITETLNDDQLPELYGAAAYVLNYPNQWDKTQNRSGSGIWLHGVPRITYSRPPNSSRGCIVSSNAVIKQLKQTIVVAQTPVILAMQVGWLDKTQWQKQQAQLLSHIAQWQSDWQSLDTEQYLDHYSHEYQDIKMDYQQMLTQTRRNAKRKTFVEVTIKNIDLLRYSTQPQRYVAQFDQNYKSNNYNISYRKQQIWQREESGWKIIFEGRT